MVVTYIVATTAKDQTANQITERKFMVELLFI